MKNIHLKLKYVVLRIRANLFTNCGRLKTAVFFTFEMQSLCPFSLNLGRLCICFDQQNIVKAWP